MSKKTAMFARHPDTDVLYGRLRIAEVGEVIGYEELAKAVRADLKNGGRSRFMGRLQSARHIAQRDDGMVFDPVLGEGLKRLAPSDVVASGSRDIRNIGRKARRAADKQSTVDVSKLPTNEERVKYSAQQSAIHTMILFTKPPTIKRLEEGCAVKQDRLSLVESTMAIDKATREMFKK